jgi:hypothetical protein
MKKIAILTTVANFELYAKTNFLFNSEYDRYVIDGRNGMHGIDRMLYMMKKFEKLDYDYVIMADEDFILNSNNGIQNLIEEMQENNFTVSGVRDGGAISHRNYNTFCINTFFSIINLKKIKAIWDEKEMLSHQRIKKDEFFLSESLNYDYDELSLYESYYCFYLWLLRKGKKIKYLISKPLNENDVITNVVYYDKILLGYHSWYARSYGENLKQTKRIDNLFNLMDIYTEEEINYVLWKDKTFKYVNLFKKNMRKVKKKLK